MTLGSYQAHIEFDTDRGMFRGEILGLNGGADFYAKNLQALRIEFQRSLDVFLQTCVEKNIQPTKY